MLGGRECLPIQGQKREGQIFDEQVVNRSFNEQRGITGIDVAASPQRISAYLAGVRRLNAALQDGGHAIGQADACPGEPFAGAAQVVCNATCFAIEYGSERCRDSNIRIVLEPARIEPSACS